MYQVVIDAGHGGSDPGAVYNGRKEKDDNLLLAKEVGELLSDRGVDVIYTRTEDIYQKPLEKAQEANRYPADLFVSFHRNSSEQENQYQGVEILLYDENGIKKETADAVLAQLEQVGYQNLGTKVRKDLIVLKKTKIPALLIETGFINRDSDNKLFDERRKETAQAIAEGILEGLTEYHIAEPVYYRIQTGTFHNQEYAQDMLYELTEQNYPAFILYEEPYYKVQTGAFLQLDNAIKMEARLRRDGYSTVLVRS